MIDAIVIAGGVPKEDDLLFSYTEGKPKALIDMNGRTMLERVIDALQTSNQIKDVIVVGIEGDMGQSFRRPVQHLPGRGNLVSNAIAGIEWLLSEKPDSKAVLASSADIPLLTGDIVDDYIKMCQPFDHGIYYNLVTRETMERRFPGSKRTFTKLKGIEVAGGDMTLIQTSLIDVNRALWDALADARKHAWQLARAVGFRVLIKLLIRQLSIADIEDLGTRLTQHKLKVILNEHPEVAMDADKPHQVELLRAELKRLEDKNS